ncbi:hypothetical protein ACHAXT_002731 [Thalassiosira profunda]
MAGIPLRVRELEEYCAWDPLMPGAMRAKEALSLETLKKMTEGIPPDAVADSFFFHDVCQNEGITHEIIAYIADAYPDAVKKSRVDETYPLHWACRNRTCPTSAVKLLAEREPAALSTNAQVMGLPLHMYMSRREYFDLDLVAYLVKGYPEALTTVQGRGLGLEENTPIEILCGVGSEISLELVKLLVDEEMECLSMRGGMNRSLPIASLLSNSHLPIDMEVIDYFIERTPALVSFESIRGNALHAAVSNGNITLAVIQRLLDIDGGDDLAQRKAPVGGGYPIHVLCQNSGLADSTSMEILKLLVEICPESLKERDGGAEEYLPIHHACEHKSFECCKFLIEEYPEHGSLELVKYIYETYPESANQQTVDRYYNLDEYGGVIDDDDVEVFHGGNYALHLAAMSDHTEREQIVSFLLDELDELYEVPAAKVEGTWVRLPLHVACANSLNLGVVKAIFNDYPKAINSEDLFERFPIHYAFGCKEYKPERFSFAHRPGTVLSSKRQTTLVLDYLIEQLPYSLKERDYEGRVCAHYACGTSNALQKVMAIGKRCTESFFLSHHLEGLPIHIACTEGAPIAVVKYLARIVPDVLDVEHPEIGLPLTCAKTPELFQFLLTARYSETPAFHCVLLDNRIAEMDLLLTKFVEFSQNDSDGEDFQCDVWKRDKSGAYPLHKVFNATESQEIVSSLIDLHPAALNTQDEQGWLPLHHALYHDASVDVIDDLILRHPEAMHTADKKGNPEAMWRARDRRGWFPLHHAIRNYSPLRIIQLLADNLRDADIAPDGHGSTPLHLACRYGASLEVMESLVDLLGLDAALSLDNNGCTPVHVACRHGTIPVKALRYLIELAPTALTAADNRGELPLHKACRGGHAELITELMAANASAVTKRNALNELPAFVLCKRSGKDADVLESVEYTEAVWQLLLAYPETVLEAT